MLHPKLLKIGVMYELYVQVMKNKIISFSFSNTLYKKERKYMLSLLKNYEGLINQTFDASYEELINMGSLRTFRKVKNVVINPLVVPYLEKVINLNRKININLNEIDKLEKQILPYEHYKFIINMFNDRILDLIVFNNYYFKPSNSFGAIAIIKHTPTTMAIRWEKSRQKKAKLIEQGLTPYLLKDKLEAEAKGEKYEGVFWLVEQTGFRYYYNWYKFKGMKHSNPLVKDYKFVPARRNKETYPCAINKLDQIRKDPVKAAALYTRIKIYNNKKKNVEPQVSQ